MPKRTLRDIWRFFRDNVDLCLIVLTGTFLRLHYTLRTPFGTRAYDWDGHMDYIDYMMHHGWMPVNGSMWEAHQSPLYYVFASIWATISTRVFGRMDQIWQDVQLLSIVISVATLIAMVWVAVLAFPRREQEGKRLLFMGVMATFPGVVFLSSRISNDGLGLLVTTIFTAFLLRWWKNGSTRDWIWACVLTAVALLTKLNVGAYCAVSLGMCLLFRPDFTWKKTLRWAWQGAAVLIVLFGWYAVARLNDSIYGKLLLGRPGMGLNRKLFIVPQWNDGFSFSLTRVLGLPFNNPWDELYNRRFFWEYLFKSAFIGEWRYWDKVWLVRGMMATALTMVLFAVTGTLHAIKQRLSCALPLLSMTIPPMLILLYFRFLHNAACNQDFRFVPNVIVGGTIFACIGLDTLPKKARPAGMAVIIGLCCTSAVFLLWLTGL